MKSAWMLVAVVMVLVVPQSLFAEAPSREALAQDLLVVRYAWFNPYPPEDDYGGIWRLDPDDLSYERLRPFLTTTGSNRTVPPGAAGGEGFLSALEDTLTYQTWPHLIDFDVYSWRMLRRLPTSDDPDELGWVIQGPMLGSEIASSLDLTPGTYGFGTCALS